MTESDVHGLSWPIYSTLGLSGLVKKQSGSRHLSMASATSCSAKYQDGRSSAGEAVEGMWVCSRRIGPACLAAGHGRIERLRGLEKLRIGYPLT